MIDGPFREQLPQHVKPILRFLKWSKISPNTVTLFGLLFALAAAFSIAQEAFLPALVLWWLGRICDGLDGLLARELGQTSTWGAFLDINFDMLAYSSIVLAFCQVWPDLYFLWLAVLLLYVLCISGALSLGFLGPEDPQQNRKLQLAAGLAEGGETGIYYSLVLLKPDWVLELTQFWTVVLCITVLGRLALARKQLT